MKKFLIFLLSVSTFSCATMKISYDYDRQSDFSKYKTYKLSDESNNLSLQQLNRDRLLNAVENEMVAKGFTKSDDADIIVDVTITGKQVQTATATTSGGYGYGYRRWGYSGGFSTTHINYDQYTEGTLVLSFVDTSIDKIVWQGMGTKTLLENVSPEKREQNINSAVQKVLGNYPPNIK